jgi:hypothetical protein
MLPRHALKRRREAVPVRISSSGQQAVDLFGDIARMPSAVMLPVR